MKWKMLQIVTSEARDKQPHSHQVLSPREHKRRVTCAWRAERLVVRHDDGCEERKTRVQLDNELDRLEHGSEHKINNRAILIEGIKSPPVPPASAPNKKKTKQQTQSLNMRTIVTHSADYQES